VVTAAQVTRRVRVAWEVMELLGCLVAAERVARVERGMVSAATSSVPMACLVQTGRQGGTRAAAPAATDRMGCRVPSSLVPPALRPVEAKSSCQGAGRPRGASSEPSARADGRKRPLRKQVRGSPQATRRGELAPAARIRKQYASLDPPVAALPSGGPGYHVRPVALNASGSRAKVRAVSTVILPSRRSRRSQSSMMIIPAFAPVCRAESSVSIRPLRIVT